MTDDTTFDRELRATLDTLAHEPAPERLVARVSEIPSRELSARRLDMRPGLTSRGIGSGFGLLAAGVAIVLVALIIRPGSGPTPVGGLPSAAVSTSRSPSIEPSSAPSASPSSQPGSTPSPTPALAAMPAGFEPISATFVSSQDGWVLGSVRCASGRCPAIGQTTDGGARWNPINAPQTTVGSDPVTFVGTGIATLRFANANDGWAYGPELWATHDGGTTWKVVTIGAIAAGSPVEALEAARGMVHAVVYDGAQDFRIASSNVATDTWTVASVKVPVGAGPVPRPQLVLSGTGGWVLENDRTVVAGARLVNGSWAAWQPVCLDVVGPAVLAASSVSDLTAACDVGTLGNPQGDHLFTSTNGGDTFAEVGPATPLDAAQVIATPGRSTIVIGGGVAQGAVLVASYDGGHSWQSVLAPAAVTFADLGFTTPTQGIVVETGQGGTSRLLMTHDAGKTWTPVAF